MNKAQHSYRQVLKATSLFGGVQAINIVLAVVKSKAIAILIGATGMGIASLLVSTVDMINGFTNFGLDRSAVRDVSMAKESKDAGKVNTTIAVLLRLVWITALLGAAVMLVLSPWLSELAFDTKDYTVAIMWLGLALVFKQLTSGRLVILQGMRHLKSLAKANILGNVLALAVSLPLYYFLKLDGIVPAIILSSAISFFVVFYYSYQKMTPVKIHTKDAVKQGRGMMVLGLTLSFSALISLVVAYVLRIFISAQSGLVEVGLYSAGFIILHSYVGLVFKAMGTDYFPRLAAVSEEIEKIKNTVYEQAHVGVLIIFPIIVGFLALAPFIVRILYSAEFDPILLMVSFGIVGMLFKAVSFSMGYIIIAKGDAKVFMTTAVIFNGLLLTLNIVGYYFYGLTGLGVSFLVYYMIHFVGIKWIVQLRYGFTLQNSFYLMLFGVSVVCLIAFLSTFIEHTLLKYGILGLLTLMSLAFSFYQLNRKTDFKGRVLHYLKKKRK